MIIKKMALCLIAFFGGLSFACAQDANPEKLTIDPLTIAPGEEMEVVVNYASEVVRSGFQMYVVLPEGLSFVTTETVDADGDPVSFFYTLGTACKASHTKRIEDLKADGKTLQIAVDNPNKNLNDSGSLIIFKVKADDALADASQIVLKDVKFNGGQYFSVTADVKKGTATGISSVETANGTVEVYDAAGVRKASAGKGLNIIRTAGKTIKVVK